MLIALIAILLAGTANCAMHRWMLESGHPAVEAATGGMRRTLGRHSTYVVEFVLLLTAALATRRRGTAEPHRRRGCTGRGPVSPASANMASSAAV